MAEKRRRRVNNQISDHTGQFDARFLLWRKFCADYDVPVDTLPSDLTGEARDRWEQIKSENLEKK